MRKPPAVSVVVPTHQRPQLMRRAVASVLDQAYDGHIQVVVVFDACEPFVPDLELAHNREIVVTTNDRSRGLAGARNTGILRASHDLVAFLDDDDVWMPEKLVRQVTVMSGRADAALVGTAMAVDIGGRIRERRVPQEPVTLEGLLQDRMAGLHSSSFLFRRECLLGPVGLLDEDLPGSYGEDYDLLLRTAKVGPILVVNDPLVTVTWGGKSQFFGQWARYAEALEYLLNKHPEFLGERRGSGRVEAQVAFAHAASGNTREARRWVRRALRHDPSRIRAYLALAVSCRVVSANRIAATAQWFGRGI